MLYKITNVSHKVFVIVVVHFHGEILLLLVRLEFRTVSIL